jgi:hypothetical protein
MVGASGAIIMKLSAGVLLFTSYCSYESDRIGSSKIGNSY